MKITTLVGCTPLVGTFVGIGRIAIAMNKVEDHKVKHVADSIFKSIKETKTKEDFFSWSL